MAPNAPVSIETSMETLEEVAFQHTASSNLNGGRFRRKQSFLVHFATSNGPPQIILLILLFALAFGSIIGVVPAAMTDRFARLNHGFTGNSSCFEYSSKDHQPKPQSCLDGSNDAQNAAAMANLVSNMLTFLTSALVGSISDKRGRKGILVLGVGMGAVSLTTLVLIQTIETMTPTWYYVASSLSGLVNWVAVALSSLSDVMPPEWRAPCFGVTMAGFMLGFAFAPALALALTHYQLSILSLSITLCGLLLAIFWLPETLPPQVAAQAPQELSLSTEDECSQQQQQQQQSLTQVLLTSVTRPVRELSILNRSRLFRLLSALAFFSGMVISGDQTLLIYYVEERLQFNDGDVAIMFGIIGVLGIIVQGAVLKPLVDCMGEKMLVAVAFCFGTVTNVLYGLAENRLAIFVAVSIGSLGGMAFPLISAIKSNNVDEREQGRIQGALYSIQALAGGLGPTALRFVYKKTKDLPYPGPGCMFIFAAALYVVAIVCACALPTEQTDSRRKRDTTERLSESLLAGDHAENSSYGSEGSTELI